MPEQTGKSSADGSKTSEDTAPPPHVSSSAAHDRTQELEWWRIPNFPYLLVWWLAVIGYYVVFDSISGRYHKNLIDLELISDARYVIFASGLIGALYAKRFRILWFLISIVLGTLILLLMVLGLGTFRTMTNS